jgi:hypothetical protein
MLNRYAIAIPAALAAFCAPSLAAQTASPPRLSTAGIPRATQRAFSVFSATPGADVASAVGSPYATRLLGLLQHNPDGQSATSSTARVVTVRPGIRVVVLAGPHAICLATDLPDTFKPGLPHMSSGSAVCNSTQRAERFGLVETDGGRIAVGLVPNGNRAITITTGGGRQITTPVIANVFYVKGLSGDRGIKFHRVGNMKPKSQTERMRALR